MGQCPFVHMAVLSMAVSLKMNRTQGKQTLGSNIRNVNRTPTSELVTLPCIQTWICIFLVTDVAIEFF